MPYTYDENIFSDLYKDANGFRPRQHEFYDATPARKQVIWDSLLDDLVREQENQQLRQEEAVNEFEALIVRTIESGAVDRVNALEWLRSAEEDAYQMLDDGYFEYTNGLPYGYLKEKF